MDRRTGGVAAMLERGMTSVSDLAGLDDLYDPADAAEITLVSAYLMTHYD